MADWPFQEGAADSETAGGRGRWAPFRRIADFVAKSVRWNKPETPRYSVVLEGMPEVHLKRPIALREHVPWLWIYVPVVAKWLMLSLRHRSLTLPTAANPRIVSGGFRGESKASYLGQIGDGSQRWVARWTTLRVAAPGEPAASLERAEAAMLEAGLGYPLIVKPDIGACGYGVRLVDDAAELSAYLSGFPAGQTVILQEFLPWAGEAGIFYVRHPGAGARPHLLAGASLLPARRRRRPLDLARADRRRPACFAASEAVSGVLRAAPRRDSGEGSGGAAGGRRQPSGRCPLSRRRRPRHRRAGCAA